MKAESYFIWAISHDKKLTPILQTRKSLFKVHPHIEIIPAYSCAELGVLLPPICWVKDKYKEGQLCVASFMVMKINKFNFRGFRACYASYASSAVFEMLIHEQMDHEYEAHAKADLLIHLLEQKIINPEDLNCDG